MTKYSKLQKLTITEKIQISKYIIEFFSPLNANTNRQILNIPITSKQILPLSVIDFFKFCEIKYKTDLMPQMQSISNLLLTLQQQGLLSPAGKTTGMFPFCQCYYTMFELTTIEKKGNLFLGKYLGKNFISDQIKANLACITGTVKGDEHVGSGVLLSSDLVLTCKHVIDEMVLHDTLKINNQDFKIKTAESHKSLDFGFIILEQSVEDFNNDIAFRNSYEMEDIVIAGYPKIPQSLHITPVFQSGEVAGRITSYLTKTELELFSAIARPGNSGGPLLSHDGKVLGIVTQSLEREQEKLDFGQTPLPFFAAIPSNVILEYFEELEIAKTHDLIWEDFQ